jgi:hypothetical protein
VSQSRWSQANGPSTPCQRQQRLPSPQRAEALLPVLLLLLLLLLPLPLLRVCHRRPAETEAMALASRVNTSAAGHANGSSVSPA